VNLKNKQGFAASIGLRQTATEVLAIGGDF